MKRVVLLACAIGAAAFTANVAQQAEASTTAAAKAARTQDWTRVVRATPAGGFVMGNPNAKVKLVEFGSMTCPHCRAFDAEGVPHVLDYVKSGDLSWEFRNYVRDAFDVSAALITRCNGAASFFPLTRAVFKEQASWEAKIQSAPEEQLKAIQKLPLNRQFLALGRLAGLQQLASAHGLPAAKSTRCLIDEGAAKRLAEMDDQATTQFPDFAGTPTFLINGKMLEKTATWDALEPQLKAALGNHG
jgi:protein-disulfide isomerase